MPTLLDLLPPQIEPTETSRLAYAENVSRVVKELEPLRKYACWKSAPRSHLFPASFWDKLYASAHFGVEEKEAASVLGGLILYLTAGEIEPEITPAKRRKGEIKALSKLFSDRIGFSTSEAAELARRLMKRGFPEKHPEIRNLPSDLLESISSRALAADTAQDAFTLRLFALDLADKGAARNRFGELLFTELEMTSAPEEAALAQKTCLEFLTRQEKWKTAPFAWKNRTEALYIKQIDYLEKRGDKLEAGLHALIKFDVTPYLKDLPAKLLPLAQTIAEPDLRWQTLEALTISSRGHGTSRKDVERALQKEAQKAQSYAFRLRLIEKSLKTAEAPQRQFLRTLFETESSLGAEERLDPEAQASLALYALSLAEQENDKENEKEARKLFETSFLFSSTKALQRTYARLDKNAPQSLTNFTTIWKETASSEQMALYREDELRYNLASEEKEKSQSLKRETAERLRDKTGIVLIGKISSLPVTLRKKACLDLFEMDLNPSPLLEEAKRLYLDFADLSPRRKTKRPAPKL